MNAVKVQLRRMYVLLAGAYIIGVVVLVAWQVGALYSFTLGTLVSGLNFYLTYISFMKLYQPTLGARHVFFAGPLPKLLTIMAGALICYQLPTIFLIVPFLVGVCLYPLGYICVGIIDYVKIAK